LKLWNSIMSGLMLVPLALAGCPSDDTEDTGAETTTGTPGTTGGDTTSTTDAVDTSDGAESTTGEPPAACPPEQPEIPPPPVDCSGATGVITSSVIVNANNPDDVAMLEGVVEVTGSIRLSGLDITNLDFMACVRVVGGDVTIFDNDSLTNVDGLWSLEEIGTDFVFSRNDGLVDFDGLPHVQKLINNLIMRENGALQRISGFHSLVGIDGSGTDPDTGQTIGGNITIQQNSMLTNIDGLYGLLVVNGVLSISNNAMLCLSNVACVGEAILQPAIPPASWTIVGNNTDC
jgi:hypothetical protein